MPINIKKFEDESAGIANKDVGNQLGNPKDDISDDYLEKRTIHGELNSPAARALKKYGAGEETTETMPKEKEKVKAETVEDIAKRLKVEDERGLEDPWIDPVSAFLGGFAGVAKIGVSQGMKLLPNFFRALVAGTAGAVVEVPIGAVTEKVGEKVPAAALPFNVIVGMVSGATVEKAIEKGVIKYFAKKGTKPAKALLNETVKAVKENLEKGKVTDEATKAAQKELTSEVKKIKEAGEIPTAKIPEAVGVNPFKDSVVQEPVYHGTVSVKLGDEFPAFSHFGTSKAANERLEMFDEIGGRRIIPSYISIKNPIRTNVDLGLFSPIDIAFLDGGKPKMMEVVKKWYNSMSDADKASYKDRVGYDADVKLTLDDVLDDVGRAFSYNKSPKDVTELFVGDLRDPKYPEKYQGIVDYTLSKMEHDGIIYTNEVEDIGSKSYIVFNKNQIKPIFDPSRIPSEPKTAANKLLIQRKRPLIEVKDIQEKVATFLDTDISDLPEKAININFARIESEEDIKKVITKTADIFTEGIQEARRGVRSNKQTEKLADMMGMSVNQLLSRRQGEAFNAENAVAARKILVSSASRLNELAQKVATREATDLDKFAFQKQLSIHYAIQAEVSGMTAEAGRALQSFRIQAKESAGALKQIDEVMKGLNAKAFRDPTTGKQMRPEDVADLLISIDSVEGINTFTRQIRKATTFDMVLEAWINGLLSGPTTHAVNTTSNALVAFWQIPERFLAAKIGRFLPGPQEIQEKEALYQAFGMVQGFKDGLKAFAKNVITGEEPDLFMKMDLPQRRAIASQNFGLETGSIAARAVDLLGEGIRIPTRFLGAEDAFFKSVGYRMELHARAFRQASQEGLEGLSLSKRITEIIADPPDDIRLTAVDAANYQTFTKQLGEGGRAGMKFLTKNPALRLIIPFVRTPANIVKFMGERTPLAIASKNIRADIAAGGAKRDLALARISMGSMIMATIATMTTAGLITGGGPNDPTLKNIKRGTGWQPYSMKIGDTYYSYNRLEPIGMLFGVAADTAEIIGQVNEEDGKTLALAGVMAFAKNVTSKTWLRGVSEAINALDSPERYGERFIQNFARSIVPTGIAQTTRAGLPFDIIKADPTLRSIYSPGGFWNETYNSIKARVPGWSKTLPPRRNLWGEPVVLEGGLGPDIMSPIYTSTEKRSPIDNELVRLKYGARMPETTQKIMGVDIPMTAEEYDQYLQIMNSVPLPRTGMNLKKSLDNLVTKSPMYKMQETDDDKIDMIRRDISTAKKWTNGPLGIYSKNRKIKEDVDNARFRLQREARKQ